MKKLLALLLALMMTLSLAACSSDKNTDDTQTDKQNENTENTGSQTGTENSGSQGSAGQWTMQTSSENSIVTIGDIDKTLYAQPVLVTSFGQSTDAAMLDTVMKKAGANYSYNATATKDDLAGYKTVIIAVGASTKGLGAAGISEAAEKTRAEEFMTAVKDAGDMQVIMCHLGGINRRGELSDELAELVMAQSSYVVVKEDGNDDGFFTTYCANSNQPITLVYSTKDTIQVFTDLFTA